MKLSRLIAFYYWMHSRTGWRHNFDQSELAVLAELVPPENSDMFFNNVTMIEDAKQFKQILQQ